MEAASGGKNMLEWLIKATSAENQENEECKRSWEILLECLSSEQMMSSFDDASISIISSTLLQNIEAVLSSDRDYSVRIEALKCGVAIFNHPRSLSHLTATFRSAVSRACAFLTCFTDHPTTDSQSIQFLLSLIRLLKHVRRSYSTGTDFVDLFLEHLLPLLLQLKCELGVTRVDAETETIDDVRELSSEIDDLIVETVYQSNTNAAFENTFKILFDNQSADFPPHTRQLISSLTSMLDAGHVPLSKVLLTVMLEGASLKLKKHVFRVLVLLCHMLRINPKLEGNAPLIECGKLERVVKLKTKRKLVLLNELLQCFSTFKLDGGSNMQGVSLGKWLQAMADYLLKEVDERPPAWFTAHSLLLTLHPSSVESRTLLFLKESFKVDDMDVEQRKSSSHALGLYLDTFTKMRRLPKFISCLLTAIKDRAYHDSESEKWASLPKKFLTLFGKTVRELPPAQILELWNMLVSQTSPHTINGFKGGKLVIQMGMCLLSSFLNHAPVADHSWPEGRAHYVGKLMESTTTDVIAPVATLILNNEHDMYMSQCFLEFVWSWGELHALLLMYGRSYPPSPSLPVHSVLEADEWAQIATRVKNFGEDKCHLTLCKLFFQKLMGTPTLAPLGGGEAAYLLNNLKVCLPFVVQNFDVLVPLLSPEQLEFVCVHILSSEHAESLLKNLEVMDSARCQAAIVHTLVTEELGRRLCRVKRRYSASVQATTAHTVFSKLIGTARMWVEQGASSLESSSPLQSLLTGVSSCLSEGMTRDPDGQHVSLSPDRLNCYAKLEDLPLEYLAPSCQVLILLAVVTVLNHLRETENVSASFLPIKTSSYRILSRVLTGKCDKSLFSFLSVTSLLHWLYRCELSWLLLTPEEHCTEEYVSIVRSVSLSATESLEEFTSTLCRCPSSKGGTQSKVMLWTCTGVLDALRSKDSECESTNRIYSRLTESYSANAREQDPYFACFGTFLTHRSKKTLSLKPEEKDMMRMVTDSAAAKLRTATREDDTKAAVVFFQCLLKVVNTLKLEMDYSMLLQSLEEAVRRRTISTDIYANVIRSASAEELGVILQGILQETIKCPDEGERMSGLENYLKIWSSIVSSAISKAQSSILTTSMKLLLPILQDLLTISEDVPAHVLPALEISIGVLEHQHLVLAPQVKWLLILPCTRAHETFLRNVDELQFAQCFPLVCKIMTDLLLYHPAVVTGRVAGFLQGLRSLLKSLTCRSHQQRQLGDEKMQLMLSCARQLERLCQTVAKEKREFDKAMPYVISDFIQELQTFTIYPKIKEVLISCISSLLDRCSEFCIGELRTQLATGPRELFLHLYANYLKVKQSQEKS